MMPRLISCVFLLLSLAQTSALTAVITGATGRTGSLTYKLLKSQGINVRGIIHDNNITNTRLILGCDKCDASEGIYVADITNATQLAPAMVNADSLVITVGCMSQCIVPIVGCHFLPGEGPKEILFDGVKTQVQALLDASGPPVAERHIMLMSMMNTEKPPSFFFDIEAKLWGGFDVGFYSLNGEAFVMNSGAKFTILKACGLGDGPAGQKQLIAAHDGAGIDVKNQVSRADVARVMALAVANRSIAEGLRFDFCAGSDGPGQPDPTTVLRDAMYPWDSRK